MSENSTDLVSTLRSRRKALRLTQAIVADVAGVSRAQIANAERGRYGLSVEALCGYARAVGAHLAIIEDADPRCICPMSPSQWLGWCPVDHREVKCDDVTAGAEA